MKLAVQLANEVLDMHDEIQRLRADVAHYKEYEQKYQDLLTDGIHHGEQMMSSVLSALINPDSRFNRGERAMAQAKATGETQA